LEAITYLAKVQEHRDFLTAYHYGRGKLDFDASEFAHGLLKDGAGIRLFAHLHFVCSAKFRVAVCYA